MASRSATPEITLGNARTYPEVRRAALRPWLRQLLREVAPEVESFGVRFVGDRNMRQVNRRYRAKEGVTDVLSFPGDDGPEGRHLGDVVICVPQARRQARRGVERELRLLTLHGVLHCLGHDHQTDDGEMERLEQRLRRRWLSRSLS